MTIYALVSENSPVRLWGLSSKQRLQRQLREISKEIYKDPASVRWLESAGDAPEGSQVLLLNGHFLFENRTLKELIKRPDSILRHSDNSTAAALTDTHLLADVLACMEDPARQLPEGIRIIQPDDMESFDQTLSRSTKPLLEPVSAANRTELEDRLYGNAYKGITDLVTKYAWPKPAKRFVHLCANLHISPNMVTSTGLVLVLAACYLFVNGHYGAGLVAGWLMTFLDTVDGKLARVTIQSSKFGHLFDHVIDLVHPPFWYIYWGMSLVSFPPFLGLEIEQMNWVIIIAYIAGRLVEGAFPQLGNCGIFTWRPFDAWFRLVTARRNPCLILMTLSLLAGKPEWGFIAVTFWTALSSIILIFRLVQALIVRVNDGPLSSWLSESGVETGPNAFSYSIFGTTRGAYARSA